MRRTSIVAGASLLVGSAIAVAASQPRSAVADSTTDGSSVYNVTGSASGVDVTVSSGYSFLVQPEGRVPRAQASVSAGSSAALASPADPGDSVDVLPGVVVPQIAGSVPPPVGTAVSTVVDPLSPTLTFPYEHASAEYPSPDPSQQGRPQSATLGTDAQVSDPAHVVLVDATTGKATAADGAASAEAGAGAATTVPSTGVTVGRMSSTVAVQGSGGRAVSDASTMLQNIDVTPPQLAGAAGPPAPGGPPPAPLPSGGPPAPVPPPPTAVPGLPTPPGVAEAALVVTTASLPTFTPPLLHIGSMVVRTHAERALSAPRASGSVTLEYAGVTFAGQPATFGAGGVSVQGSQAVALQPLVDAFNALVKPAAQVPPVQSYQGPNPSLSPPQTRNDVTHNGDEDTAAVTGLTLTIASTAPLPGVSQSGPSVTPSPVTYVVTLGNASSEAYGLSLPQDNAGLGAFGGLGGLGAGGFDWGAAGDLGGAGGTGGGAGHGGGGTLTASTGGDRLLSRPLAVALASLLEALLLGTLVSSYRAAEARRREQGLSTPAVDMI